MNQKNIDRILSLYDVKTHRILEAQKGYRNEIYPIETTTGEMIQLTLYKSEQDIMKRVRRADEISTYLATQGFPTRRRIDERTIQLDSSTKTIYAGLYNYLPGSTIAWEAYTRRHIVLLGKTLSDIHTSLSDFTPTDNLCIEDESELLLNRICAYLTDPEIMSVIAHKLGIRLDINYSQLSQLINMTRTLSGRQPLHMDFVRGNVLFRRAQTGDMCVFDELAISGILDFEKTAIGHPLYDVARTLAFLLVDCKYKTSQSITKYFIHSGYQKRGSATLRDTGRLLDQLVLFFLVHDFYKFLRHNPYESLAHNEHFIRTRDILSHRGVIHYL